MKDFIAFIKVRISEMYQEHGRVESKVHLVKAETQDEAYHKVQDYYYKKNEPYNTHYDVIETVISEDEIIT